MNRRRAGKISSPNFSDKEGGIDMTRTFRLGVFIILTLAVLSVGVFLIGSRQFMFSRTYKLEAEFKSVSGLSAGAEVRVGGIHKGTVRQIDLPGGPDGQMKIV